MQNLIINLDIIIIFINLSPSWVIIFNNNYKNNTGVSNVKNNIYSAKFLLLQFFIGFCSTLMRKFGYGKNYQYIHDAPDKKPSQTYFPKEIGEKKYYQKE